MSTFTERIHALVIERAELEAAREFPPDHLTADDVERVARNMARDARIAETFAEAQQIIIEQLREETSND